MNCGKSGERALRKLDSQRRNLTASWRKEDGGGMRNLRMWDSVCFGV